MAHSSIPFVDFAPGSLMKNVSFYIPAYLLLNLTGNKRLTAQYIKKVFSSVGIESEAERVEKLVAELSGKNVQNIIAEEMEKFACCAVFNCMIQSKLMPFYRMDVLLAKVTTLSYK